MVSRSPIKCQQLLSKEIAVEPWCNQDVVEEARLAVFVASFEGNSFAAASNSITQYIHIVNITGCIATDKCVVNYFQR